MAKIKSREIPAYFELEQSILSTGRVADKSVALALLRDGTKGSLLDKARFLSLIAVVTYCGSDGVPPAAALKSLNEEYDAAFTYGCTSMAEPTPSQTDITRALAAVTFLRRTVSLQSNPLSRRVGTAAPTGGLQSFLSSAQTKIKSAAASWFAKFVALWITKVVDNLTEGRGTPEDESFVYFDPKLRPGENPTIDARSQKHTDVMVFAVGGGCYSELNNLQELLKQKQASGSASALRSVVYGATEILSGDSFYKQLDRLATPQPVATTAAAATPSAGAS